jgi:hypothetical protein
MFYIYQVFENLCAFTDAFFLIRFITFPIYDQNTHRTVQIHGNPPRRSLKWNFQISVHKKLI